jgi:hypothetical protein
MSDEIPYGLCRCGCGQKTPLCTKNDRSKGEVKGQPKRFIKGHSQRAQSHRWRSSQMLIGKSFKEKTEEKSGV